VTPLRGAIQGAVVTPCSQNIEPKLRSLQRRSEDLLALALGRFFNCPSIAVGKLRTASWIRRAKRLLGVEHPVGVAQRCEILDECLAVSERGAITEELQAAGIVRCALARVHRDEKVFLRRVLA
jgi:hypothetical protein